MDHRRLRCKRYQHYFTELYGQYVFVAALINLSQKEANKFLSKKVSTVNTQETSVAHPAWPGAIPSLQSQGKPKASSINIQP